MDAILRETDPLEDSHYVHDDFEGMVRRVTSSRSWHRRRAQLLAAVACVAAACVVVALVTSTTNRTSRGAHLALKPGQALSSGQKVKLEPSGQPFPVVAVSYDLTAGPNLSTSQGSAIAYALRWPADMSQSALDLARVFGIDSTTAVPNGLIEGGVLVGSINGPNVDVFPQEGILNWMYQDPTATSSASTPTSSQATADALALLAKIGITENLGTPQVSPNLNGQLAGDIAVSIAVVVNGDDTNLFYDFVFGSGGSLVQSDGALATVASVGDFPTISQVQAVAVAAQGTYSVDQQGAPTDCGVTGTPPCKETVNSASMSYRTFTSSNGSIYLLPTWQLTGEPESSTAPMFGAWVSAIQPQFVSDAGKG
jgi:hypothetical protein